MRLGELQQGLAKLQAEGVVEGLAAAKAKAAREAVQAKEQVAAGLEVQAVKQEAEAVEREQNHRALVLSAAPPLGSCMTDIEQVVHVKEETQQRLQRLPPPPPPPPQQVDLLAPALAHVVSIKKELAHAHAEGQQPPAEPPGDVMQKVLCVKREVADTVTDTACTQNKRQKC